MGLWTNNGLNTVAQSGAQTSMTYVGISLGCGTLASGITAGVPVTSLALDGTLPANLTGGQSLTVTDGSNTETVTVGSGGASAGTSAISINSWTPANTYAAHTTGVAPTPLSTDTALYAESVRVGANPGVAGASAGETLVSAYFDGTQATGVYLLVGYFGGTATGTTGTGTLVGADVQYWDHTVNSDTNKYEADTFI